MILKIFLRKNSIYQTLVDRVTHLKLYLISKAIFFKQFNSNHDWQDSKLIYLSSHSDFYFLVPDNKWKNKKEKLKHWSNQLHQRTNGFLSSKKQFIFSTESNLLVMLCIWSYLWGEQTLKEWLNSKRKLGRQRSRKCGYAKIWSRPSGLKNSPC